jgi:predicted MFS family arabinose efflux permease
MRLGPLTPLSAANFAPGPAGLCRIQLGPHVNRADPGIPGGTGLKERATSPRAANRPRIPSSTTPRPTASPRPARTFGQVRAALGMTGGAGPRGTNWQVLSDPKFRLYFAGSVISNFGTWLQNTAQVVLAYQLTHSVLAVGLVTCAQFTSPLLLGPWAAVLTHRIGTWRALMVTQIASTVIAALLTALEFSGTLTVHWLFGCALAIGLFFTFALPAMSVTVAGLFSGSTADRAEVRKRAMAMDSVSYNLGRAVAPVVSVLIFTSIGFGWAFALNAGSYLLFTIVLMWLRPRGSRPAPDRSRVGNGLHIALHEPRIMVLLLMVAAVTVAADPILVLGPALAGHFHSSADWSGIFIAALGAGNVLGSLRPSRRRPPSIRRAAAVLAMLALTMMIFANAPSIWLSAAAAFGAGMACLLAGATARSLLLECAATDEKRQAAVMAAWAVAWAGSKPIASLADGSLASLIGVRATGILLALPALLPALVLILLHTRNNLPGATRWSGWLADAKGHH